MNLFALLAAFLLDRAAKLWAEKNIGIGETMPVIKKRLYFRRVRNYGFANNVLSEKPEIVKNVSTAAAAAACFYAQTELKDAPAGVKLGFSLMLGGGLSNLADRIKNGYVTDFITFKEGRTLAFNPADFMIFAGGAIFAVFSLLHKE